MTKARIIGVIAAVLLAGGAVKALVVIWRPALGARSIRRAPQCLETALIKRGRELTATGNCNCCHSMRGGKSFGGGRELSRAFGTVFFSGIAPDGESGIGRSWQEAFRRAMGAARLAATRKRIGDTTPHRTLPMLT
jgi:hypothetical protein